MKVAHKNLLPGRDEARESVKGSKEISLDEGSLIGLDGGHFKRKRKQNKKIRQ